MKADRRDGNRYIGLTGRYKLESGTCNVCSAPCSSCVHRNAGSVSEESPGENSHGVVASQCSFNEGDLLRSSRLNLVHDTSSEHSESQEVVRSSNHQVKKSVLVESSTHSVIGMVGESGENIVLNKGEEPNTLAMSDCESADSEPQEVDVKICDTCGDAGREDLLAICSRCSDGAEHTYCMRVMLKKVPAGDWLCEECKFAEQAEKQKRDKESKRKQESEANLNTQSSSKRPIDRPEAAPDAKRQAFEAPTGSPKKPVLPRLPTFSRETSFKRLEKTTRKLAHHSSFNSHSSDDTESTRSTDSQVQSPKGSLFKSKSFNSSSSRPKVRPVDDVMPKEGLSRKLGRSMSTRCIDVGSSGCNDSRVQGSKQLKDRSTEASGVDQKLISRGNSSSSYANSARDLKSLQSDGKEGSLTKKARHLSRNRLEDIVASVGDTHTNENSKDAVGSRRRSSLKDLSSQKIQTAEPAETSCSSGSNLSTTRNISEDVNKGNRLRAAVDAALRKKPSFGKNRGLEQSDLPSVSNVDSSCDRALQNFPSKVLRDWPVGLQGGQEIAVNRKQSTLAGADAMAAPQSLEPAVHLHSVKPVIRDLPVGLQRGHPNLNTDKQTIVVNRKQSTLAGTDAIAAPQSVEPVVHLHSVKPVMRDLPVGLQGGHPNLLTDKQAIAVNRKQSTLTGADAMAAPQSVEPAVHLHSVKPVIRDFPVGLQRGHPNLQTDKQTIAVNRKQFPLASADAMAASQSVEPTVHFHSVKPVMSDLPGVDPSVLSTTSAIPEPEYIWQGEMEVRKSRNLSAMHCGMQAYLSTLASPKVAEVVNQFPVKVTLNEVPRLSTWPSQFQDIGAKEGHVALFFFAKDIVSYERSYKPLVDNMIQKDLALKGSLEGVELLIFASNQLPRNCQRWNMFFFLWGVFRGKNKKCSDPLKNKPLPASNVLPNMGRVFSTREGFYNENPSNRESLQSCMKEENAKEGEAGGGDSGAVEETEEGEIGSCPQLKDEKISGPRRVNSSDVNHNVDMDDLNSEGLCEGPANKKLKTGTGVETECNIFRRDTSGPRPREEENVIKKNPVATERIVFPLDLNDGKEEDTVMVDNNPRALGDDKNKQRPLGMVPNLELALGEDETTTTTGVLLPFMAGPSASEKHRSSNSQKAEEENAASLSLSLSFSSLEKEQQQQQRQQQNQRRVSGWEQKKQNVNTPMFLFRDFPDKSS
uniref:Zinc finger PHD-type domain-containing protein n=1 Tax=Brassica campestris TaxID=3711 RepID=M4DY10_BRACM